MTELFTCHQCGYPLSKDQALCPECGQTAEKSAAAWKIDGTGPTPDGHALDHAIGAWLVSLILSVAMLIVDVVTRGPSVAAWFAIAPAVNLIQLAMGIWICRAFVHASLRHTPYVWKWWTQGAVIVSGWASLALGLGGLAARFR